MGWGICGLMVLKAIPSRSCLFEGDIFQLNSVHKFVGFLFVCLLVCLLWKDLQSIKLKLHQIFQQLYSTHA